jgi:hypothetical protein
MVNREAQQIFGNLGFWRGGADFDGFTGFGWWGE